MELIRALIVLFTDCTLIRNIPKADDETYVRNINLQAHTGRVLVIIS